MFTLLLAWLEQGDVQTVEPLRLEPLALQGAAPREQAREETVVGECGRGGLLEHSLPLLLVLVNQRDDDVRVLDALCTTRARVLEEGIVTRRTRHCVVSRTQQTKPKKSGYLCADVTGQALAVIWSLHGHW
jgi:hypothetical protein